MQNLAVPCGIMELGSKMQNDSVQCRTISRSNTKTHAYKHTHTYHRQFQSTTDSKEAVGECSVLTLASSTLAVESALVSRLATFSNEAATEESHSSSDLGQTKFTTIWKNRVGSATK